ncbi:MAG: hypothetical protein RL150_123 [Candidatus Parcubacteria bacterium]
MAVLTEADEIPDLPNNKLIPVGGTYECVSETVPRPVFRKIARLQTLCFQAYALGGVPDIGQADQQAALTGSTRHRVMEASLSTREDMVRRIMMLERLIVEIVRETFPAECSRFDVEYFVCLDDTLRCRPAERRRFFD